MNTQLELPIVDYYPEFHMYIRNGIVIPSVTQVASWVVRKDYSDVPASILNAKADYGNRIHEWVEKYSLTGESPEQTELMKISTDQWAEIMWEKHIDICSCEQVVCYKDMYAGTYDMLGYVEEKMSLIDIKTTAKFDKEYLKVQLSMYKLALEDMGVFVDECYCLWMPKGKTTQLLKVETIGQDEVIKLVKQYNESLLEDLPF